MKPLRYYINLINENLINTTQEKEIVNFNPKELTRNKRAVLKDPKYSSGKFSYGYEINPNEYELSNFKPSATGTDPQQLYFNAVKDLIGSNPYAPIVYRQKIETDTAQERYTYQLEKLSKYSQIPISALYYACKQAILGIIDKNSNKSLIDEYRSLKEVFENHVLKDYHTQSVADHEYIQKIYYFKIHDLFIFVHKLLTACCRGELTPYESNLKEILNIISTIKNQNKKFFYDLNPATNILYRGTSYGAQMVITDPLGY